MAETSLVGRTLGQYQIVSELGRGQRAVVYRAWLPDLERHVALKVLMDRGATALSKLETEAQRTAHLVELEVPNLRRVYEVGRTEEGYPFVALEFVDYSLRSRLRRAKERNRRLSPAAAVRLLRPIAEALDAIHRLGWVHLDVKPENILTSRSGRAVLADLGIMQRAGTVAHVCTPAYASPEQAGRREPVGPYSDIYSLGVVLYEMLTGRLPFRAEHELALLNQHLEADPPSLRMLNPRLGVREERAVLKALSKAPAQRHSTATGLLDAVVPSGTARAGAARVFPGRRAKPVIQPQPGRGRLVLALVAVLVTVLALVIAVALWSHPAEDEAVRTPSASDTIVVPGQVTDAQPTSPEPTARPSYTPRVVVPKTATAEDMSTATLVPTNTPEPRSDSPLVAPAGAAAGPNPRCGPVGIIMKTSRLEAG